RMLRCPFAVALSFHPPKTIRRTSVSTDERPLFEDAIDVPLWLEADAEVPLAQRRARDREIARKLEADGGADDDVARVRDWWTSLRPADGLGAALVRGRHV